jgi:hypothetical protein
VTSDAGRARHLSRRSGVRSGIPSNIALPKFLTPPEIKMITELKDRYPDKEWEEIVDTVINGPIEKTDGLTS